MMNFRLRIYAIIILLFSLFFFSCNKNESKEIIEIFKVRTISPEETVLENKLRSIGSISYRSKHNVSCSVEGNVEKICVKEGDFVKKGQLLGRLKNIQLEIQKEQCENNLDEARASLLIAEAKLRDDILLVKSRLLSMDKQKLSIHQQELEYEEACAQQEKNEKLFSIGGLTRNSFKQQELKISAMRAALDVAQKDYEIASLGLRDEDIVSYGNIIPESYESKEKILLEINTMSSVANVRSEKSRVNNAEKNLFSIRRLIDELDLKASVDGIVGSVGYETGEHVEVNNTVFTLIDVSSVNVVFYVQENDISSYKVDGLLSVEIPSVNKTVETRISEISPLADPLTGNFWVKASLVNENNEFKPGMFVKIDMDKSVKEKFLSLPETAVIFNNSEKAYVFVVAKSVAVLKDISIKTKENGKVFIEDGIEKDEKVIDRPSPFLKEGDRVEEI